MSRIEDFQQVMIATSAFGCSPDEMKSIVIEGSPPSKARPRFGKGGRVYSSDESRKAEKYTRLHLLKAFPEPLSGNVSLVCIFYRPNRQRIDADNMLKHVCDAANGVVWIDDSQVTAITGIVELDSDAPRTVICVARHKSTMKRGEDDYINCKKCGEKIFIAGKQRNRNYCSSACAYQSREGRPKLAPKSCAQCSGFFSPANRAQKLCSEACRRMWMIGRNQAAKRENSSCLDCGKQLSHKRGGRCRGCWRSHVKRS